MGKLLLLFILIPAIELVLLLKIGSLIGILPTVGIIVITGIVGASLARQQGLGVLRQMQSEMAGGQLPAGSIIDGVLILMAAALLLTPGFLTDMVGFTVLVPGGRTLIKKLVTRRIEHAVRQGNLAFHVSSRRPDE
jgi:UPF0716 protein FxsA